MKNTIKRALLLIPVISVLLVALAVPVFADYSPETGWDAPVGSVSPIESVQFTYWDKSDAEHFVNGSLGSPFVLNGETITFRYKVVFNIDNSVVNGYTIFIDGVFAYGDDYKLGTMLRENGSKGLQVVTYESIDADVFSSGTLTCYVQDYPFAEDSDDSVATALSDLDFEVYEISSISPTEPVTSVFTDIMTWITSALTSVMGAFYVDGSLTLLGTLAVIGVSVGIGFLLIGIIQRFLKLRG